jgi:diacylglycerol kinase family enzyme
VGTAVLTVTRALLITNPVAARTEARAVAAVRDTLRGGGWTVDLLATHGPGDARRFAAEARMQGFDALVCYGGDGTTMQIAAAIQGTGLPLGLVPGGTGNLLAGNLRLPRHPVEAARAILKGRPKRVDMGVVERADGPHYFAVAAGAGYDAVVMAATSAVAKQRWKVGAYWATTFATLPDVHSVAYRLTVDGQVHTAPAAVVLVANCAEMIPPFFRLGPTVAPDDGWLDVVAVRADGVIDGVRALLDILLQAGNGAGTKRIFRARGHIIRVEAEGAPWPVQLDGESAGETPFEARVLPGALAVLVNRD